MARMVKIPLRRSFSEHVKDSSSRALDLFWKSAREKRLSEIEAKEACDWLRAAGFPQYVQLFRDCQFPIDVDWVKSDHKFLDKDAIDSLCRRLNTLNKCAEMKLETHQFRRRSEDSEEEEPCAISANWTFERRCRLWSRQEEALDFLPSPEEPQGGEGGSVHSSSSSISNGKPGEDDPETSSSHCSSSSCRPSSSLDGSLSAPPSPAPARAPEKPPRKKRGRSLMRKMEKLRLYGGGTLRPLSHGNKPRVSISGPVLLEGWDQGRLDRMRCVDLSGFGDAPPGSPPSPCTPHSGSASSSHPSSTVSTPSPVTRTRGNRHPAPSCDRSPAPRNRGHSHPATPLNHSPAPCNRHPASPLNHSPAPRNRGHSHPASPLNHSPAPCTGPADQNRHHLEGVAFHIPQNHKPGTFPRALSHSALSPGDSSSVNNSSVNWRTGSFHGYRGKRGLSCSSGGGSKERGPAVSPLALPDKRVSVYDNVPSARIDDEDDEVFSALDGVMERISSLQHLVAVWGEGLSDEAEADSDSAHNSDSAPCPPAPKDIYLEIEKHREADSTTSEDLESSSQDPNDPVYTRYSHKRPSPHHRRLGPLHWSSELELRPQLLATGIEAQPASHINLLQKLSLLKLTALMDKFSPCSKQGWSWTVPKTIRKTRAPDSKDRVFGVPLLQSAQLTGNPLPPGILNALQYLRADGLDQVGLFRKSGVKSRIQFLREMVEANPAGVSFEGQSAFDVADMVKQYFRDLPEPIFSSKLCESFLHIYQYFPKDQQFPAVQAAIFLLPDENREALHTLLHFLGDVVACARENQMTPTNVAVCLAPSLFHLNTLKRDNTSTRSSHRKGILGRPDQRDLSENLAATQGLAHMVAEASRLFQVPKHWQIQAHNALGDEDLTLGDGWHFPPDVSEREQDRRAALDLAVQSTLREAREGFECWVPFSSSDDIHLAYKKVESALPSRCWKGGVEVGAAVGEVLQRLLREQRRWEAELQHCAVIETLGPDTEVYRYTLRGTGARPPQEHLLLRTWQCNPSSGATVLAAVSTEHPDAPAPGPPHCVRAQVLTCVHLLEPLGVNRTRLTHICHTDTGGRSPEWYNKVAGHLLALKLGKIRDSFK